MGSKKDSKGTRGPGSPRRAAHGVHAADLDRGEQFRGVPQGRGEPPDGHALAAGPKGGPRLGRGAGVCPRGHFQFREAHMREVLVRGRAGPDRRRAARGSDDDPDRCGPGPFDVDGHQGGASQLRRVGGVSAVRCALQGPGKTATAQAAAPEQGRRPSRRGAGLARQAVEPGADLPLASDPASRSPGMAPRAREHLPGDLRPGFPAGTGDFRVPADPAPPPASASRPGFPAWRGAARHDDDRRAPAAGRRSSRGRPLGR